jgi:hypothetical protein
MRSAIDAFIALWDDIPKYRWAARLARTSSIHGCHAVLYDGACVPVSAAWNRRARKQVGHGTATWRRVG